MRSRYTAYTLHHADHLLRTWHPSTQPAELGMDRSLVWDHLDVLGCLGGQVDDMEGTVEFRARWRRVGPGDPPGVHWATRSGVLRERSLFHRRGGRWRYVHAEPLSP